MSAQDGSISKIEIEIHPFNKRTCVCQTGYNPHKNIFVGINCYVVPEKPTDFDAIAESLNAAYHSEDFDKVYQFAMMYKHV